MDYLRLVLLFFTEIIHSIGYIQKTQFCHKYCQATQRELRLHGSMPLRENSVFGSMPLRENSCLWLDATQREICLWFDTNHLGKTRDKWLSGNPFELKERE